MTFSAGYIVPIALAATAADATVRHQGITPEIARDDGVRWFFAGVGTYRVIKRHAAAMREAMAPEESAALLVDHTLDAHVWAPALQQIPPRTDFGKALQRSVHAMARERRGLT